MNIPNLGPYWFVEPLRAQSIIDAPGNSLDGSTNPSNALPYGSSGGPERPYMMKDGVAIIPVKRLMTKDYGWYGCSTKRIRAELHEAIADREVRAVLFVVDSPGGEAAGCEELFNDVRAAAKIKPVDVFYEDSGASAAYYGFCGARKLLSNATGWVGCLGSVSSLTDASGAYEQMGLKKLVFSTGPLKGVGAIGAPVTDEQKAYLQSITTQYGEWFFQAVRKARKIPEAKLRSLFTGAMFTASDAVKHGLIDGIGTLDAAVSDLIAYCDTCPSYPLEDDETEDKAPAIAPRSANFQPTISATSGGTGLSENTSRGAGTERTRPTPGGASSMKNLLVRALTAFKLPRMATAITVAASEEPEALVSVMAEQVEAEVSARLDNHPLMQACMANSIATPLDLQKVLDMKALGESHLAELRSEAKAEAIRAYGSEAGPQISAQVDNLTPGAVRSLRNAWKVEADTKFGLGQNGQAAERQTAPKASAATATDAETPETPKRPWDRLSAEQQAHARAMGITTENRQDAFALNVLKEAGK